MSAAPRVAASSSQAASQAAGSAETIAAAKRAIDPLLSTLHELSRTHGVPLTGTWPNATPARHQAAASPAARPRWLRQTLSWERQHNEVSWTRVWQSLAEPHDRSRRQDRASSR